MVFMYSLIIVFNVRSRYQQTQIWSDKENTLSYPSVQFSCVFGSHNAVQPGGTGLTAQV